MTQDPTTTKVIVSISEKTARQWSHSMKTDTDDIQQEICILLLQIIDQIDIDRIEDIEAYLTTAANNAARKLLIREHEQGLWITDLYEEDPSTVPPTEADWTTAQRGPHTVVIDDYLRERRTRDTERKSTRRKDEEYRERENRQWRERYPEIKDRRNARRRERYARQKANSTNSKAIL